MSSQLSRTRCVVITLFALLSTTGNAAAADDKSAELPLKRVVLFSSGVGFFEHNGQVNGDAKVELKFNVRRHQRSAQEHGAAGPGRRHRSRPSPTARTIRSPRRSRPLPSI